MEADSPERRAEIARRLKAARWLAGGIDTEGKAKVTAISPDELAGREPLPANEITGSKIGAIERMERYTPPMELDALAKALGLQSDYFTTSAPTVDGLAPEQVRAAAELLGPQLLEAVRALGPSSGTGPSKLGGQDRPPAGLAGDGG